MMAQEIQLVVTLKIDGPRKDISVSGPLADKFLCYMMLEGAKDAVRDYKAPIIQPASPEDLIQIKGNGKAGHS